jgi:hypothetical protein
MSNGQNARKKRRYGRFFLSIVGKEKKPADQGNCPTGALTPEGLDKHAMIVCWKSTLSTATWASATFAANALPGRAR